MQFITQIQIFDVEFKWLSKIYMYYIFFINTTKHLSITHFTTSEFYLTEYLNYEYAPSRYIGCVTI